VRGARLGALTLGASLLHKLRLAHRSLRLRFRLPQISSLSLSALLRNRSSNDATQERKDMRKYAALHSHLNRRNGRPEMLTFEDIEQIIGKPLPHSAHKHRSFWANDNQDHHSHARAWMRAGYKVAYVDREQKVIRFERTR
jgi:hypothetical protein